MTLDEMRDLKVGDVIWQGRRYWDNIIRIVITDVAVFTANRRKLLVNANSKAFFNHYERMRVFLLTQAYEDNSIGSSYSKLICFQNRNEFFKEPLDAILSCLDDY